MFTKLQAHICVHLCFWIKIAQTNDQGDQSQTTNHTSSTLPSELALDHAHKTDISTVHRENLALTRSIYLIIYLVESGPIIYPVGRVYGA